jgi:hypothetical protein
MAAQKPTGSAPGADGRPRAQVSYEGEDEFSAMSLDPSRRRKAAVEIEPSSPGSRPEVHVDELKPRKRGMIGFLRKIFDK